MASPSEWLLLALRSSPTTHPSGESRVLTSIQLQKAIFVLQQSRKEVGELYRFVPFYYGPYAEQLAADLRELVRVGLIARVGNSSSSYEWELTQFGVRTADELTKSVPGDAYGYLSRLTTWMRKVSISTLLKHVYERYPDYARKNVEPRSE